MSKTYSEGGIGRKKCGGCPVFVPARSHSCPDCGYVFPSKLSAEYVAPKKEIPDELRSKTTYTEGGMGRKQCSSCRVFVPARTTLCPNCQYDFKAVQKVVVEEASEEVPSERVVSRVNGPTDGRVVVWAPAGRCPVELPKLHLVEVEGQMKKVFLESEVKEWIGAVISAIPGDWLTHQGLLSWARHGMDPHTEAFQGLKQIVMADERLYRISDADFAPSSAS